jgi:hypothetical protein
MQSKPITSRLRANKQIKKDPNAQPLLHVGEVSPLKQTVTLDNTTERAGSVGEKIVESTPGAITGKDKKGMGNDAWKEYLKNETEEQRKKRYDNEVKRGIRAAPTETVTETPGTPGEIETNKVAPQIQDDFTGITPWHNRQNQRTARQSERDVRRSAGGDLRRLAKFESRNLKGADKRKLKRDIRKGNYEGEFTGKIDAARYSDLTKEKYGVTEEALQTRSSNMQQQQANQGINRDEKFKAVDNTKQFRDVSVGDVGTATGKATMSNYRAELGEGYETNLGGETTIEKTPPPAAGKMLDRQINAVGVKQTSPMKKGYFKNK